MIQTNELVIRMIMMLINENNASRAYQKIIHIQNVFLYVLKKLYLIIKQYISVDRAFGEL